MNEKAALIAGAAFLCGAGGRWMKVELITLDKKGAEDHESSLYKIDKGFLVCLKKD
jgi:hypothetical protein